MLSRVADAYGREHLYIDKTEVLEKGIAVFPSIYIEGPAGTGKTVAVRMLLAKHAETEYEVIDATEWPAGTAHMKPLTDMLEAVLQTMENKDCWLIVENINQAFSDDTGKMLADFIRRMPLRGRVLFVGRERPDQHFLALFWEKRLELITREMLRFSLLDIEAYLSRQQASLSASELYKVTGGWAGCVDNMIRLALNYERMQDESITASELRKHYEIDGYIQQEILGTLSKKEQQMVQYSRACPWLNAALCADVWHIENPEDILEKLERKGILNYQRQKAYWKLAPLFQYEKKESYVLPDDHDQSMALAAWYEQNHYIKEALICAQHPGNKDWYRSFILRNYAFLPLLGVAYEDVLSWKESAPQFCYLRGVDCHAKRDFQGLEREIARLEKQKSGDAFLKQEILLNLYYLLPDISLDDWLDRLKAADAHTYRLYNIPGNAQSCLCGLRDLSGLFACSKKEENAKAKIWKSGLGPWEWYCYQLARVDYYLETERCNVLRKEDVDLMLSRTPKVPIDAIRCRQFDFVRLFLFCKLQRLDPGSDYEESIGVLENRLLHGEEDIFKKNTEAILSLYAPWRSSSEKLTRWLKFSEDETKKQISERNYFRMLCMAKGYLLLNQYEKARRLLKHLIPYLREYKRWKLLSEMIFAQALVNWEQGNRGLALQNVIEVFIINGNSRYVDCYAGYGKKAQELLEAYVEWLKGNAPERWHRKKKYQYGNVLRMPQEDYLDVVLRCARREARTSRPFSEGMPGEHLTMMETIILQEIARGLSNNEICRELNLKLPTVKSHIYSLYKKLGINSRVQAVIKGKEMGI